MGVAPMYQAFKNKSAPWIILAYKSFVRVMYITNKVLECLKLNSICTCCYVLLYNSAETIDRLIDYSVETWHSDT